MSETTRCNFVVMWWRPRLSLVHNQNSMHVFRIPPSTKCAQMYCNYISNISKNCWNIHVGPCWLWFYFHCLKSRKTKWLCTTRLRFRRVTKAFGLFKRLRRWSIFRTKTKTRTGVMTRKWWSPERLRPKCWLAAPSAKESPHLAMTLSEDLLWDIIIEYPQNMLNKCNYTEWCLKWFSLLGSSDVFFSAHSTTKSPRHRALRWPAARHPQWCSAGNSQEPQRTKHKYSNNLKNKTL